MKAVDLQVVVQVVVIVQHDGEVLADGLVQLVHQRHQEALAGGGIAGGDQVLQGGHGLHAELGVLQLDGSHEMGQEAPQLFIQRVERIPAIGQLVAVSQVDQQGGLAIAGRRGDDDQLLLQQVIEQIDQPLARQDLIAAVRRRDLGAQDREIGH